MPPRAENSDCEPKSASFRPAWSHPQTALAAIIVLDQFPRNMFRGTPRAFAADAQALALSRHAVDQKFDSAFPPERKQFLYMPLMHSEALADQERSVALFEALGDENSLRFAREHRDIVARFGRIPHRNKVLSRMSSQAEEAFLAAHEGYGQ